MKKLQIGEAVSYVKDIKIDEAEVGEIKIHRFKYYTGDNLYKATKEEADEILRKYCSGYLLSDLYGEGEESLSEGASIYTPICYNNEAEEDDTYLKLAYTDYVNEAGATVTYTVTAEGKLAVSVSEI